MTQFRWIDAKNQAIFKMILADKKRLEIIKKLKFRQIKGQVDNKKQRFRLINKDRQIIKSKDFD